MGTIDRWLSFFPPPPPRGGPRRPMLIVGLAVVALVCGATVLLVAIVARPLVAGL